MDKNYMLSLHLQKQESEKLRQAVREELINKSKNISGGKIDRISTEDLRLIFEIYDRTFFKGYFQNNFSSELKFSLSQRMSRNAGKTVMKKDLRASKVGSESYEIVMAVKFLFNYEALTRDKKVNGINTTDALNALQLVFEHEILHLLEFHLFKKSSCSGDRFKKLAGSIFGHTDVYHQLPTEREIVREKYGFKIGDYVTFLYEEKNYKGFISAINKRVTVMVINSKGEYRDREGNRYRKWYVPLESIKYVKK
jgi:hypothetical protein